MISTAAQQQRLAVGKKTDPNPKTLLTTHQQQPSPTMKPRSSCELCGAVAAVYCSSDSAFLCAGCDARVHGANFLAARHVRTPIACTSPSNSSVYDDEDADEDSASSVRSAASSCISTAESAPSSGACRPGGHSITSNHTQQLPLQRSRTRRPAPLPKKKTSRPATRADAELDPRAEGVLSAWCSTLGDGAFGGSTANCAAVVASHAMAVGLRRLGANVHPRVCAAAAVWFAFKLCGGKDHQRYSKSLRKLEECSAVPARVIAAAESKLSRVVRRRQQLEAEGWAECDSPPSRSNDECTV